MRPMLTIKRKPLPGDFITLNGQVFEFVEAGVDATATGAIAVEIGENNSQASVALFRAIDRSGVAEVSGLGCRRNTFRIGPPLPPVFTIKPPTPGELAVQHLRMRPRRRK